MVRDQPLDGQAACGRPTVRFGPGRIEADPADPAGQLLCQEVLVRIPVRYQVAPGGSGAGARSCSGATVLEQRLLLTLPVRFGVACGGTNENLPEAGALASATANLELTWNVQVEIPIPGVMSPDCGTAYPEMRKSLPKE